MDTRKFTGKLSAIAISILLASCGGGGSDGYFNNGNNQGNNGNNGTGTETPQVSAEVLSVGQSKASLNAGTDDSLTLTIRTLDKNGGIIPKANVKIEIVDAVNSGASLGTTANMVSDDKGIATTSVALSASSNLNFKMNRTITLIITSGKVKQELTIPVNGTVVAISSDVNLLEEGQTGTVTVSAVDAAGKALVGAKASLVNSSGEEVFSAVSTDNTGNAVFKIPYATVKNSPNQKLELIGKIAVEGNNQAVSNLLSSGGITLIANVANNVIQIVSDSNPVGVGVNKNITVKVSAPTQAELVGKIVNFETTNGAVTSTATITNIRQENGQWVGNATTVLNGAIAAIATISAQFGNNVIYISQQVSAGVPKTISIQSEVSVLAPGANTKVIALVKDQNGTPIPNVKVNFKTLKDTSLSGKISQPSAVTDSAGRATVIYTAGSAQTLGGGVEIQAFTDTATAPAPVYSENLLLTVSMQSAFITVAHNQQILKIAGDETNYYKEFSATVVDTAGNPIPNQKISISLDLESFYKGEFKWVRDYTYGQDGTGIWDWYSYLDWSRDYTIYENKVPRRVVTYVQCPSTEFPNPISILAADGSILNTKGSFVTDSQGKFAFKVRYNRNYSNWLRVNLTASTVVSTKDNKTALSFMPAVAEDDVDNVNGKWRPDRISPYGTDISTCSNYK
ncbi:Ig-like domain-containing protein [Acinetobacter sp. 1125_18A]|uniref:Ig-like domain-containing protein n=1 Tax=Acinetobacter sp. 1125_18A TaxID=2605959 RepID=UPI0040595009